MRFKLAIWAGGYSPLPPLYTDNTKSNSQKGQNITTTTNQNKMERQNPARPPDKKKARKNERDTKGETGQLTTGTSPRNFLQQSQTLCCPIENP